MFWALVGLELLVLGYFGPKFHLIYSLLLLIPAVIWFFKRQGRNLQSMIVVSLDQLAKELNLSRLPRESESPPVNSSSAAPSKSVVPETKS